MVTGQNVLGGKVVRKVRLAGADYLVDWFDGQRGQVGQVYIVLESEVSENSRSQEFLTRVSFIFLARPRETIFFKSRSLPKT